MSRYVLIVLAGLGAACADLVSEPAVPEARGLALVVEATPVEISPGDTARIVARLRNSNPHEATLNFNSGCQILFYVEDAAGRLVEPQAGGWACRGALTTLRLGAGQTLTRAFPWTGQRVAGYESGTYLPIREGLPAGAYRVYATLVEAELDGRRISLRSAALPLRLR